MKRAELGAELAHPIRNHTPHQFHIQKLPPRASGKTLIPPGWGISSNSRKPKVAGKETEEEEKKSAFFPLSRIFWTASLWSNNHHQNFGQKQHDQPHLE